MIGLLEPNAGEENHVPKMLASPVLSLTGQSSGTFEDTVVLACCCVSCRTSELLHCLGHYPGIMLRANNLARATSMVDTQANQTLFKCGVHSMGISCLCCWIHGERKNSFV